MVDLDKEREEIEMILEKIGKEIGSIVKYDVEKDVLTGENEIIGVLFVLPQEREKVEEKIEELFPERKVSVVVFSIGIQKFIKKFAEIWKHTNNKNLQIGEEITDLRGDGIAIYINWTNNGIVLHQYKEGKFLSRNCKKVSLWETSNGIWIAGFKDKKEAEEFVSELKEEIKREFKKDFSINYHSLCFEEG